MVWNNRDSIYHPKRLFSANSLFSDQNSSKTDSAVFRELTARRIVDFDFRK